jgi:hypothetical protein
MRFHGISRRKFLKKGAVAGGTAMLGGWVPANGTNLASASHPVPGLGPSNDRMKITSPAKRGSLENLLGCQAAVGIHGRRRSSLTSFLLLRQSTTQEIRLCTPRSLGL